MVAWTAGDKVSYRIIWVLTVSMIAFTVAMWVLFSLAYRYAIKGVINEYVLTSASELASEIRASVGADISELRSLAADAGFRSMDATAIRLGLTRMVNGPDTEFFSAFVLGTDGKVLDYGSSTLGEDEPVGIATLPNRALKSVLAGQSYVAGWSPESGAASGEGRPYWLGAVPITEYSGSVVGVLVGMAEAAKVQEFVSQRRLGKTGAAYVVDGEGHTLAQVGSVASMPRLTPGQAGLWAGERGVTVTGVGTAQIISAHANLQDIGWGVLVRMDQGELLAGYNRLTLAVIAGSILLLAALVGGSIRKINSILAPLSELTSAVERVGSGDYGTRVDVAGTDEIATLAGSFNSMVIRVRETERAKTEFVSLASHELRTPLTSIKGYASTLLRRDVMWDEKTREEFLRTINAEADRLGRLVSDMLDVSRIGLGRLECRLEKLDIGDLARQVARQVATTTERHRFALEVPETRIDAIGDRDRVEQVLHNLYSNAVKYSPAGGDIVTRIRALTDGSVVRISVTDQGVGIDADKLAMIFDRFYRVRDPATADAGGTGLGLFITKHLVEAMGGTIEVHSAPGSGTAVSFTLKAPNRDKEVSA